ncbi:MAG: poly(R)-hydroxyalkanoic acid synthase subunit PhaE [Tumebacillaceae bacterium]
MQGTYFDPFSVWKNFYNELEPKMSQSMQKWLESEEYAAFSGQLLNATLQMQQQFIKNVEQVLQTYNIPTVKDIARLGEMLVGLESKVDTLDERMMQLEQLAVNTADVRAQLSLIAEQLEAIGKALPSEEIGGEKSDNASKSRKRGPKSEEGADDSKPGLV